MPRGYSDYYYRHSFPLLLRKLGVNVIVDTCSKCGHVRYRNKDGKLDSSCTYPGCEDYCSPLGPLPSRRVARGS